jgi:TolA-binding protein
LARALCQDSFGGMLYGEEFPPSPSGRRGATGDPGVESALVGLVRREAGGALSADDSFWLVAGLLARNDLDNAAAHLREALRRHADDPRLASLTGILAYKQDNLAAATPALAAALARRHSATNLYNLALARGAQGDTAAAQALTRELLAHFPRSVAASVARAAARREP